MDTCFESLYDEMKFWMLRVLNRLKGLFLKIMMS